MVIYYYMFSSIIPIFLYGVPFLMDPNFPRTGAVATSLAAGARIRRSTKRWENPENDLQRMAGWW